MTTLCRVQYCPECAKNERPKTNQLCLFYGAKRNGYFVRGAIKIGTFGYTPHILKLVKVIGDTIIYESACSLNECGVDIWQTDEYGKYSFKVKKWSRGSIPINQWNAWTQYKHDSNYDI